MPTLASLKPGESAFVTLLDEGSYTCKLLNLGILPKAKVTMVRKSPFGGAFYIKLEGWVILIPASLHYLIISPACVRMCLIFLASP
jgi:Fe2+ transport system protein FeoA